MILVDRLEKVRHLPDGALRFRCPACAEAGGDRKGQHGYRHPGGGVGCAVHPDDPDHLRRIMEIAGEAARRVPSKPDEGFVDIAEPLRRARQARQRSIARMEADEILGCLVVDPDWRSRLWEASSPRLDWTEPEDDGPALVEAMFPPTASIWSGSLGDSGQECHAPRFRPAREHLHEGLGRRLSTCSFKPGSFSRSTGNVERSFALVLESDEHPKDIQAALVEALAVRFELSLAAVVDTGGRSLHAWFRHPGPETARRLEQLAGPLGLDADAMRVAQPIRTPGFRHEKTGRIAKLVFLGTDEKGGLGR